MPAQSHGLRQLFWIPIIHTPADLGSLSETSRQLHLRQFGKKKWDQRIQTVEAMWRQLRLEVEALNFDFSKVCLYQDGLPCCGHELDIVRDLAKAGSLNHQFLLDLVEKGAKLVGTESPNLLLEEYELSRQILTSAVSGQKQKSAQSQQELSKLLLERRDGFIAQRINETLAPGETGLVFLGMLHSLEGRLSGDLVVTRLGQDLGPTAKVKAGDANRKRRHS